MGFILDGCNDFAHKFSWIVSFLEAFFEVKNC